jgi:hypothetical protein
MGEIEFSALDMIESLIAALVAADAGRAIKDSFVIPQRIFPPIVFNDTPNCKIFTGLTGTIELSAFDICNNLFAAEVAGAAGIESSASLVIPNITFEDTIPIEFAKSIMLAGLTGANAFSDFDIVTSLFAALTAGMAGIESSASLVIPESIFVDTIPIDVAKSITLAGLTGTNAFSDFDIATSLFAAFRAGIAGIAINASLMIPRSIFEETIPIEDAKSIILAGLTGTSEFSDFDMATILFAAFRATIAGIAISPSFATPQTIFPLI